MLHMLSHTNDIPILNSVALLRRATRQVYEEKPTREVYGLGFSGSPRHILPLKGPTHP
jgi:hypothetical protein